MMKKERKKICLISSSGGHFEQLLLLKKLGRNYDIYFVTEKTPYNSGNQNIYCIKQVNRKEKLFIINMLMVTYQSLKIFLKEKPDVIISTGALCVIPTFFIGKLFKRELIFIESFANISTPTLTGKLLYKISDLFVIQWEDLKVYYPNAIYLGSIY